ncbi:MAG: endonuclease III [Planctomycetota bacterium]
MSGPMVPVERPKRPVRTPGNPRGLKDLPFPVDPATPSEKRRAKRIFDLLTEAYPDADCELDFSAPHELLIATILSAQSTDAGVNRATPGLFAAFPEPTDYAAATPKKIEPYIKTIGLFRNKAKAIHSSMKDVVERYDGRVPTTVDKLLTLRGVARKTAGVVLGEAYGINDCFVVDTHVTRLATRLGFVEEGTTVAMIERRMMSLVPRKDWRIACHRLIFHGRRACSARGVCEHPICKRYCSNAAGRG